MSLTVGTKGFDSANSIDPKKAYKAGGRFQMRYSAGVGNNAPATKWKLCKVDEIEEIIAAGSLFIANSEWYKDRCTEGAIAGLADGAADLAFWKSRGLRRGSSIYISWDESPSSSKYVAVRAYIEAYNKALGGYYVADGLYAGIPALIWMSHNAGIKHGWVPSAAGWSFREVNIPSNYAPPAKTNWQLWFPEPKQVGPAIKYILEGLSGHKLVSCIWQSGGQSFSGNADNDIVIISGPEGGMAKAAPVVAPKPKPHPVPHPIKKPQPKPKPVKHKTVLVHRGDSLSGIANKNHVKGGWRTLQKLNNIKNPNVIYVGQKIRVS